MQIILGIMILLLYVMGWLFTLSKLQNEKIEDAALYNEDGNIVMKVMTFIAGFTFWWLIFIIKLIMHIWKFLIERW